jgi:hypothetical protein
VTRVFDSDSLESAESGGAPEFNYSAIFVSASAEILGLLVVIQTVDSIGRVRSQVISFISGGILVFGLAMLAGTSNTVVLTILAFFGRACMMSGSCSTWVSTAEIYHTEIRTTGHR